MTQWKAIAGSALLFRSQRSRLPQTLIFFVTSRCNARCDFCLYAEQIADPVAKDRELTVDEVRRIAANYGPLHYLALSGGEPFVRDDLEPICQAFIDECGVSVVDIPSNFAYRDRMLAALEPLAAKNPDVIFDLQMSLDHIGEKHDISRVVPGLYDKARDSFEALAALRARLPNLKLKISVVYLERNRDDLDEIVATIGRDFDCDRVQLGYPNKLLPTEGGGAQEEAEVAGFRAAARSLDAALPPRDLTDLHTLGMKAVKGIYGEMLADAASGDVTTGQLCDAGRIIAVLDEKGDVFGCEPLWEPLGNVRENGYDIGAVLHGPAAQAFREKRLGPGRCNCTWGCAMHSHISTSPKHLPRLGLAAGRITARRLLSRL